MYIFFKIVFEIQFAKKHMERVNPGEVEVEKMANELATCGDLSPWNRYF